MSKVKEEYYSQKKWAEKNLGLYSDDITDYVDELEQQNKEMLEALINMAKYARATGRTSAMIDDIIEKQTGKSIEELLK